MIRCTLCRQASLDACDDDLEPTTLPGTGYRCIDHDACRMRVAGIVEAHRGLGEVCVP